MLNLTAPPRNPVFFSNNSEYYDEYFMLCWRADLFFLPPILCDLDDIPCTWKLFLSANYGNLWFQVLETCVLIFRHSIQHD